MCALDLNEYHTPEAVYYGISFAHFKKACRSEGVMYGQRVVHFLIGLVEIIPLIGQIAALFEKLIVTRKSKNSEKLDKVFEPEKKFAYSNSSTIARPVHGLPNPLGRCCYMNAALMALFPISGLFENINDPLLQKVIETYKNPEQHASELEIMLTSSMNKTDLQSGDASQVAEHLFKKMLALKPELIPILSFTVNKVDCCDDKKNEYLKSSNYFPMIYYFPMLNQFYSGSKMSEVAISTLKDYTICEDCNQEMNDRLNIPKYFLLRSFSSSVAFDQSNFEWKNRNFRLLSAVETRGHAISTIQAEDGNWYKYDDSHVSLVDPTSCSKYGLLLIENLSFQPSS